MIDRYHLRYFLAVIDQGNFTKAAAACNVSQPTLSVGIARLEAMLGHALFRRTNRRVELTEAGARLAASARAIEAGFREAERSVADAPAADTLRLGLLSTIPGERIATLLRRQRDTAGAARVEIVEGRERELHERLARGRIDVALTILRDPARADPRDILFSEGYALALPADHPRAGEAVIAAEALAGEAMIVRRHCELLAETSRHFTARGVRPFFPARVTSDARALAYVRAGLGITVMPESFVAPGVVRPQLADFPHRRTIGLLHAPQSDPERQRATPLLRALAEMPTGPSR